MFRVQQKGKIMSATKDFEFFETWQKIFALSSGNEWVKIPDKYRRILGLDSRLGIIGGILCTRIGAIGLQQTIERLNKISHSAISKN